MQQARDVAREIEILTGAANKAMQEGKGSQAITYWGQILLLNPNHIPTLAALGKYCLATNDDNSACKAFERVCQIDGSDPQQWISLAIAYRKLQNIDGEQLAVQQALVADPMDMLALIMKADLHSRLGETHQAALAYGSVVKVAPPMERIHPNLRPSVEFAMQYKANYDQEHGKFLDDFLAPVYKELSGEKLDRFRDSVDIMVGRKKRYDSQSLIYHYPNLAPIEFFDRKSFPWLADIENGTEQILTEFMHVLGEEEGFTPYLEYTAGVPMGQLAELNNSPDWSAYHLIKDGLVQESNAAKCPNTMQLLSLAPQPIQLGKTPSALFSLLKPHTHIRPHTGASNVRLLTHIPLIIPNDCRFRVGNQTREWIPGEGIVFDDTIEHEAWNHSDKLRVVMIFDIWHPDLSEAERHMITEVSKALLAFKDSK